MIFPIVLYGDPILKKKASEVAEEDESIKDFVTNMFETMYAANGVGLAAPQINQSIRVFVVDTTPMGEEGEETIKQAFINPILLEETGKEWIFEEGCLSIPDIRAEVSRKGQIRLAYFDENWEYYEEIFEGINARVIQHEYDHLEGKLFINYLTPFKKRLIKKKLTDISKGKTDVAYQLKIPKS